MRISAREACVKPHLRTLSDIKYSIPQDKEKSICSLPNCKHSAMKLADSVLCFYCCRSLWVE